MHQTTLVHKKDEEGALTIETLTGQITTPISERPEWAAGLVLADLSERLGWYAHRLGENFTQEHKTPQAIAYEDLSWMALDEDGELMTTTLANGETVASGIQFDHEFRMNVIATITGVERSEDAAEFSGLAAGGRILAEAEVATDQFRTSAEITAFQEAQKEGFNEGKESATG
jgi:hypothetical protein